MSAGPQAQRQPRATTWTLSADPLGQALPARLRIGTRRSALALTQTRWLATRISEGLAELGHEIEVELVEVTSRGDVSKASLASLGGTGVFVSALREALLDGRIDLAVHSLKDMPTGPAEGLVLAAVPVREDPRDVLVARDGLTLAELPRGARIGTGSPRRAAQLRALGFGLDVVDIRGNVDTRVGMVASGAVDGVLLAHAGLLRLGRGAEVTQVLDTRLMLPAPGQGALAAEARSGDLAVLAALSTVDDLVTRACVTAERALLARLEAGCAAPVGALATIVDGAGGPELFLEAAVGAVDGSVMLRQSATVSCPAARAADTADGAVGSHARSGAADASVWAAHAEALSTDATALGESLADDLLAGGAAALIPDGHVPGRTDSSAPAREGEP